MSLQQKLSLKLQQKMVLTPTLQQAIRLLQLTRLELQTEVTNEMLENPVLEEASTIEEPPQKTPEEVAAQESAPLDDFEGKIDVEAYFQDYVETNMKYRGVRMETPGDAPDSERYVSWQETLVEHLLWQVAMSDLGDGEKKIAQNILGCLDENGYFQIRDNETGRLLDPVGEVCTLSNEEMGESERITPPVERNDVERVLAQIQKMDPIGTAARDLRECLLIQLDVIGAAETLAAAIVRDHLESLGRLTPMQLSERLEVDLEEVEAALLLIRTLDPKPGLKYATTVNPAIVPDAYVIKDGDDYRVILNEDGLPRLRLSSRYRTMAEEGTVEAEQEARAYLKERVRSALWFLKSLEERQRTIFKVVTQIVEFQRNFLDNGPAQMRPLILRDVAERVGVHESTVSRVVSNKYIQTPRGILPMKYFFNTGISTLQGVDVSSMKVKERLKHFVDKENPKKPLSDQKLADILKQEGILLARRTVAKYREELSIPPSARRKVTG